MATNKKRKLIRSNESDSISAFAARKQLQPQHGTHRSGSRTSSRKKELPVNTEEDLLSNETSLLNSFAFGEKHRAGYGQRFDQNDKLKSEEFSGSDEDEDLGALLDGNQYQTGHSQLLEQLWTQLTTVDLSKGNAERRKDGTLQIRIGPGEKLVVLGQYGLSVTRGQITILGAVLSSSKVVYDVYAPSSHSLPVIRYFPSDIEKAEILLHESKAKLSSLMHLSPLFAGLWSTSTINVETSDKAWPDIVGSKGSSFQVLLNRDEDSLMGHFSTVLPPLWNELLSKSATERIKYGRALVTMVCGPKASGKSTFSRLLINRLLTLSPDQEVDFSVAFLDLDPGQPEFSPPGQLSLFLLSNPYFGPPFSHPDGSKVGGKAIRTHSLFAVSPVSDPDLYMACAIDLISCYKKMLFPSQYPLVINTPGWILGTGLELLTKLVKEVCPSQVIYMSQNGPHEVVESLQAAAKSIPVLTVPSQPTRHQQRTSAHLRTMQYMSYFHLDNINRRNHAWNPDPVTSMAPLEVKYAGKAAGILGIMCLGEQPPSRMLRDAIDGSLVAVVIIEDMATVLNSEGIEEEIGEVISDQSMPVKFDKSSDHLDMFTEKIYSRINNSAILRTPEGLPYFHPANTASLDPRGSQTIGLAMIRGIDVRQQMLQLLTPISMDTIRNTRASGKAIVLVRGKLDTPGWAYLEAMYKKRAELKEDNKQCQADEIMHDSEDDEGGAQTADFDLDRRDGFGDVPWVEILRGDKGREVGARVWRVRRDLGKTSGAGD